MTRTLPAIILGSRGGNGYLSSEAYQKQDGMSLRTNAPTHENTVDAIAAEMSLAIWGTNSRAPNEVRFAHIAIFILKYQHRKFESLSTDWVIEPDATDIHHHP